MRTAMIILTLVLWLLVTDKSRDTYSDEYYEMEKDGCTDDLLAEQALRDDMRASRAK